MSIKDTGYLEFFGEKCIYVQDDMDYVLIPVNKNANIFHHYLEKNYRIEYSTPLAKKSIISVREELGSEINSIRLKLNYIAKCISDEYIDGFIMTGNEIDEFFSPLEYYFKLKRTGNYSPSDLLYNAEKIANYKFKVCNKDISIDLKYGNILSNGIKTDLSIHAQLIVRFEKTKDFDFINQVYNVIILFLQFVHRKKDYNIKNIELFKDTDSSISKIGYMFSSLYNRDLRSHSRIETSFLYYGDKIEKLFAVISTDPKHFPIKHLCEHYEDMFSYSFERFSALCSAFEYEYSINPNYPQYSILNQTELKDDIVEFISNKPNTGETVAAFKEEAIKRIQEIGSKPGLKKKIINAFNYNKDALEKSLPVLLARVSKIEDCAKSISQLRGKMLHNDSGYEFDDNDLECIRFLNVLQFVMVLRRADYTSSEIEIIIGRLFNCNSEFMNLL